MKYGQTYGNRNRRPQKPAAELIVDDWTADVVTPEGTKFSIEKALMAFRPGRYKIVRIS